MSKKYANQNDLMYAIGARVKNWADMTMPVLRRVAENCDNAKHVSRGALIEYMIEEEFAEEFPASLVE